MQRLSVKLRPPDPKSHIAFGISGGLNLSADLRFSNELDSSQHYWMKSSL